MAPAASAETRSPIQRLLDDGTTTGLLDGELVERLNGCAAPLRDSAFQALVERHGPLVWRVCRHILRNAQDAEDAFQAAFLVLLHKADTLRVQGSLGPWLYQVAVRVSQQAMKQRRRRRIVQPDAIEDIPQPERDASPSAEQLAMLHHTLNGLPARYREPIVLCHLEGRTHEEAARILRCPVGTVSGRLSRGRALLRTRLERRGWNADDQPRGLAALSPVLLSVPSDLIRKCLESAGHLVPSTDEALLAHLMLKGALNTMFWSRMRGVVAVFLVVCAVSGTAGAWFRGSLAAAPGGEGEVGGSLTTPPAPGRLSAPEPQSKAEKQTARRGKTSDQTSGDLTLEEVPPVVVRCVPESGTTDVDPGLKEIKATFSKAMTDKSWSWSTASKSSFPTVAGDIRYLEDGRTCVLPVKLEPGRTYATWINSERFRNFKDRDGRPALPYLLVFRTRP